MSPIVIAENTYDTASTSIAIGAVISWTSAPPRPGPPISAIAPVIPIFALPSSNRAGASSDGRYVRYAISNTRRAAGYPSSRPSL